MDRENINYNHIIPRRNKIFDFLNKAYAMVNDPSTDSIISWSQDGKSFIVWNPEECFKDLLTRVLGITNFARFETYGFRKIVSGQQLEFACDDFVRGQPELLEKIGERYVQMPILDRLKICTNLNEEFFVIKERSKENENALAIKDLEELREDAILAIHHLKNQVLPKLKNHINQENDIQKLQVAINVLNEVKNAISNWRESNDRDGSLIITNFHLSSL